MNRPLRRGRRSTAICSICNQPARPLLDHLCSLSTCNHVFHNSCLRQRSLHRPLKTNPRCPVCTKEFTSMRCIKPLLFQSPGSASVSDSDDESEDAHETVRRMREKISDQEASLKRQSDQLSVWKGRAEKAEAEKEMFLKEKEKAKRSFHVQVKKLSRKALKCPKLWQQVTEMEEELAALKTDTDLDVCEEEMVKIQSILGDRMSQDDIVYVLRKSLAIRNKQVQGVKLQSDRIAKDAKHTLKKFIKREDKIETLETRVEELEKITLDSKG